MKAYSADDTDPDPRLTELRELLVTEFEWTRKITDGVPLGFTPLTDELCAIAGLPSGTYADAGVMLALTRSDWKRPNTQRLWHKHFTAAELKKCVRAAKKKNYEQIQTRKAA